LLSLGREDKWQIWEGCQEEVTFEFGFTGFLFSEKRKGK
jgi:hypothetical protein